TALGARTREEALIFVEWITAAIRDEILREDDRQILLRHRHDSAGTAVDDRNRRAPVALAGNSPVTQPPLDLLLAELQSCQIGGDGVHGLLVTLAVVVVAAIRRSEERRVGKECRS